MAIHARQIAGSNPEKTIVGRTPCLDAAALGRIHRTPLMRIVARRAGDIVHHYQLAGGFVEKGEIVVPAFRIAANIGNQFALRVRSNKWNFILGGAVF